MAKMLKKMDTMTTFRLNIPPSWDKQTICLKIKNYSLMYEQEFYLQEIK